MKGQLHLCNPLDTSHWPSLGLEDDPAPPRLLSEEFREQGGPFCSLWLDGRVCLINLDKPELPFSPQHLVWLCFPLTRIHFNLLLTSALVFFLCSHIFSPFLIPFTCFFSRCPLLFLADHLWTACLDLGHNFCRERKAERILTPPVWAEHCLIQYTLFVWRISSVGNFY